MTAERTWQDALELGASTLYEAAGGTGAVDPAIRPVWKGAAVCGPAFTVKCAKADNLAVHRALERCRPGDVLVVDAGGDGSGYCGDVIANAAIARGVVGAVVDGGVRDIDAFERLRFPVFSRWVSMRRSQKKEPGAIGDAVHIGGVEVHPGDIVVGDADGVFVTPAATFAKTVEAGEARVKREEDMIRRIRAGELTLDLLGLRRSDA
jgi:4-hydroxy-4-methyl-2-oxoglutarate aldolase